MSDGSRGTDTEPKTTTEPADLSDEAWPELNHSIHVTCQKPELSNDRSGCAWKLAAGSSMTDAASLVVYSLASAKSVNSGSRSSQHGDSISATPKTFIRLARSSIAGTSSSRSRWTGHQLELVDRQSRRYLLRKKVKAKLLFSTYRNWSVVGLVRKVSFFQIPKFDEDPESVSFLTKIRCSTTLTGPHFLLELQFIRSSKNAIISSNCCGKFSHICTTGVLSLKNYIFQWKTFFRWITYWDRDIIENP